MRNGTETAVTMMIPPIVGVPALTWCLAGPSSRMNCPNSRCCRKAMNFGDRKMQISRAAVPAMSTSPIARLPQGLRDDLEPDAARALDEHGVARRHELVGQRRGGGRVGHRMHRVAAAVERGADVRGERPDADQHVDAALVRVGPDL